MILEERSVNASTREESTRTRKNVISGNNYLMLLLYIVYPSELVCIWYNFLLSKIFLFDAEKNQKCLCAKLVHTICLSRVQVWKG